MRILQASLVGIAITLAAAIAEAQVDAERFKPAVTHDGWVTSEGSETRATDDPWEFGAFLNYAHNPLITADGNGELRDHIVGHRLGLDLLASVSLADPFAVGLGLPLYFQSGDADPSVAGLGDLRLVPKLRILRDRDDPFGLALAAELRAPTHTGDFSGGARNVSVVPKLIFDHRFFGGLRLGANAGVAIREGTSFANINAGSEFVYAAALGYRIGGIDGKTELGIELAGAVGLAQTDKEEVPLEALPFVRHDLNEEWEVMGGFGVGVLAGYGVPTFRVFVGVRYQPTSHDADGDGIADSRDKCPNEREDVDNYEDHDGCPEEDPDTDQDGIPDHQDRCPDAKETINGSEDDDGCPDSGDPRVIYEDSQFKILDTVQFEHGSAQIKPESHSLLDQVALTIKANPQVKRVRVEGHTDDTGPRDVNVRLSKERAESVRQYLAKKGVRNNRLSSEGYGPDKPLVDGTSDEARAKNRRVEFIVE
ncbi:MAG TPA: OmpA family protein [Polyangiaceae bacterium]|nr:OmpA family protein [Polyangiaceae bacterium]